MRAHCTASELQYTATSWESGDSFAQDNIKAICQTTDGYLWLGTRGGLVRFNGVDFKLIAVETPGSARPRPINALCSGQDGSLWIAFEDGVLAHLENGRFSVFRTPNFEQRSLLSLVEDGSVLWVGTSVGLMTFIDGRFELFSESTLLATNAIRSVIRDETGKIWAGYFGGITCLERGHVLTNYPLDSGGPRHIRSLLRDSDDTLWAGTDKGLFHWNRGNLSKDFNMPRNNVNAVFRDRHGTFWAGTPGGLFRMDDKRKFSVHLDERGHSYGWVHCFFEDREGNLWMGTKDGLHRLNIRQFAVSADLESIINRNVISFLEDRQGNFWAATWGSGVFQSTRGQWVPREEGGMPMFALSLHEGQDGAMWFGMDFGGGLHRIKDGRISHIEDPGVGLGKGAIRVIHEDRKKRLWVGAKNGLFVRKQDEWVRYTEADGLPHADVRTLAEDHEGNIWVGTEAGMAKNENGGFRRFTAEQGMPEDSILALRWDKERNLWIGTATHGLYRWKDGKVAGCISENGLHSNVILEILEDNDGRLWMSSNRGVFHINKPDLENFLDGRTSIVKCVSYGKADGLLSATGSAVAKPSAWKSRDGRLWFPTSKGVVVTNPKLHTRRSDVVAPIVIEEVVFDREVQSLKFKAQRHDARSSSMTFEPGTLNLPPGRGELEIRFTALSFRAPEKDRYKYKLEGADADWVDAGARRFAHYNNLAPGNYVFRVTGANQEGVWNSPGSSIKLTLQPHSWQTGWFKGIVALAAAGIVGGTARQITRHRMRRRLELLEQQHALEKERIRIAQDMHDELGAQMTEIVFLNDQTSRKKNNPEEVEAQTEKISEVIDNMAQNLNSIIWAVNPANDSVDQLASHICKYVEKYLSTTEIRYRIDVPVDLPHWPLSSDMRHNIFLVVKEALNNIAKHAQATEVRLGLKLVDSNLVIEVEDNGRGFSPGAVTSGGNGLNNMPERLRSLGGDFSLDSAPGKGTRIHMKIPVRKQAAATTIL